MMESQLALTSARGQRAVVEFDTVAQFEGVGLAVVGRLRHLGTQIADEIRRRGCVLGIDAGQRAVNGAVACSIAKVPS
jgi:hypothetical protein